jgi:hypothetical protein
MDTYPRKQAGSQGLITITNSIFHGGKFLFEVCPFGHQVSVSLKECLMFRQIICLVAVCTVSSLVLTTNESQARHSRHTHCGNCIYGSNYNTGCYQQSNYSCGSSNGCSINSDSQCGCNQLTSRNSSRSNNQNGGFVYSSHFSNSTDYQQSNFVTTNASGYILPACCSVQPARPATVTSTTNTSPGRIFEQAPAPVPGM